MVVPVAVPGAAGRDSVPVMPAAVGGANEVLAAGTASRLPIVVSVFVEGGAGRDSVSVVVVMAGGAKELLAAGTASSQPGIIACLVVGQKGGLHFSRGAFVSFSYLRGLGRGCLILLSAIERTKRWSVLWLMLKNPFYIVELVCLAGRCCLD